MPVMPVTPVEVRFSGNNPAMPGCIKGEFKLALMLAWSGLTGAF